jgi:hypothetical protein
MPQTYQVRGIKFLSTSNDMAMGHSCTFVISLPVSGSYWVTHALFMDDSSYSDHVRIRDKEIVVARGASVAPSSLTSDATWPREIFEPKDRDVPRSRAKLIYIRKKGEKRVSVKIDVWAKKFQSVQFYLLQERAASDDETIEMIGKVRAVWDGFRGEEDQSFETQPWGVPFDSRFAPT